MSEYYEKSPIRVPVKFVDGHWEYFYGGGVPVREGALGDLIIERHAITDGKFLTALKKNSEHRILDQVTKLLVALTIRTKLDEALGKLLIPARGLTFGDAYYSSPRPSETAFISVSIGPPSKALIKRRNSKEGGIWLHLEGTRPKGITTSNVNLPEAIFQEPADSLNHAFTQLSEQYEPWRKSHTGNIYTRVLYEEANGKWYPLQTLRSAAEAKEEQVLLKARWTEILNGLSPDISS